MRASRRVALAVAGVAIAAGLPSLGAGFVHDDHRLIEQNSLIRGLDQVGTILTRGYWTVDETPVPNLYRPVTILSFALNRAFLGEGPAGYRIVDLLLHAAVAVLVFLLARRVAAADGWWQAPALAGFLFAVHPVHTEALGLVVGRAELLAALGVLGALLLFLAARDRTHTRGALRSGAGAWRFDAGALGAYAFGFLAKENAVLTPILVLAADLLRVGAERARGREARPAWGVHAAFAALAVALVALRTAVLGTIGPAAFTHFVDNPIPHLAFPLSTATALAAAAHYAWLLVAPWHLSLEYSYDALRPAASLADPAVVAGALVTAGLLAGIVLLARRRPAAAFALAFIAVTFAPVSNLVLPIGTILAERLLYLPSAGFVIFAALVAAPLAAREGSAGRAARAAVVLVLVAGGLLSARRLLDFRDDLTLSASTVETAPRSVRAQFNFGAASERAGDDAAAERAYEEALAIWPDFADAHYNLAGLLARQRRLEPAIAHYREALRLQPGSVTYLVNLGATLVRAGRPAEAIEPLERAAGLDPRSDRAWNNLGGARLALGDGGGAARAWREAIAIAPENPEYAVNLALALDAAGDPGAAAAWSDALAHHPRDGLLRYRLGKALERAGRDDEAAGAYRDSARLAPDSPVPQRALGMLLHRRGDDAGARAALETAARLDPGGTVFDAEARALLERLRGRTR